MYIVTRDTGRVVKLCGQDAELVNSCVGISYAAGGNAIAAHAVLAEVDGLPRAPAAARGRMKETTEPVPASTPLVPVAASRAGREN